MGSTKYPVIPPPGGGTPSLPGEGQPKPLQPNEYGPTSVPTVATFNYKNIAPPTGLYIGRNDTLEIYVLNSATGLTVDLHARLLLASPISTVPGQPDSPPDPAQSSVPSNSIVTITQNFVTNTSKTNQFFIQPLAEGWLLNLSMGVSPGFSKKGQTYVVVILQRGDLVNSPQSGALLSGYVTSSTNLIWPQTGTIYTVDGAGWLHSVQQGNPAAGADFVFTVPTNTRWKIRSLNAAYAVANSGGARLIHAVIRDGSGNQVYQGGPNNTANINGNIDVCIAPNIVNGAADTQTINIPIPSDTILSAGFTIGSSTNGIQVGDQYSAIWAQVEEWLEN